MNTFEDIATRAAAAARSEAGALGGTEEALVRAKDNVTLLRISESRAQPRRWTAPWRLALVVGTAACLAGIFVVWRASAPDSETAGTAPVVPKYLGAGFTAGWIPKEIDALTASEPDANYVSMGVVDRPQLAVYWSTEPTTPPGKSYPVGLHGINRNAMVFDNRPDGFEVREQIGDVYLSSQGFGLSEEAMLKFAARLTWDADRAWHGDAYLGGGLTARHIPDGYRIVATSGTSSEQDAPDYAVTLMAGEHSLRVDIVSGQVPAEPSVRMRHLADRTAWVSADDPAVDTDAVLDGLMFSDQHSNDVSALGGYRAVLANGTLPGGSAWLIRQGERSGSSDDCLLIAVADAERQVCPADAPQNGAWFTIIGGHGVLVSWPAYRVAQDPLPLLHTEAGAVTSIDAGYDRTVLVAGAEGNSWPEGTPCVNRSSFELAQKSLPGVGAIASTTCDRTSPIIWVAPSRRIVGGGLRQL